jgi:sentrin-specific protease 1
MRLASLDGWLDDSIILEYLALVCRGSRSIALDTLLYPALAKKGLSSSLSDDIIRRAAGLDPLSYDYIVIPVHLPMHWTVILVDVGKRSLYYSDSLRLGAGLRCLKTVESFLVSLRPGVRWRLYDVNSPRQQNGNDCGVFTCEVARRWVRGLPLDFSQEDIPGIRARMVRELKAGMLES